jgi:hypothetical protein
MEDLHKSQSKHGGAALSAAAAYGGAQVHAPGSFVNLSA